jgi:hypothetical protein
LSKASPRSGSRKRTKFRSKFEKKVHDALTARRVKAEYEKDTLPYSLHLKYKPDWKVGERRYLEAKGKFDYTERRKILAVIRDNPGVHIHMLFMRNNRIRKGSDQTYGSWCDDHGISWSVFPDMPI